MHAMQVTDSYIYALMFTGPKVAYPLHSYPPEMCMTYGPKFPVVAAGYMAFLPGFLYKRYGWRLRKYLNIITVVHVLLLPDGLLAGNKQLYI